MNQKHHSLVKLIGMLLVVMGVSLWLGTSNRMEVQAASIPQPTAIDQLFPDTALAEVMRAALGKTSVTDTVSQSELDQLTNVSAVNKNIQSIEGLQYVNNLTFLYLTTNQISDVSPLAALNKLTYLSLDTNQISDVSPLAALNNLSTLNLNTNQISDVSPLAALNNLTSLYLYNNQISDVSPLAALNNLTYLFIVDQQINQESIPYQPNLVLPNVVKDGTGSWIAPRSISNNGTYTSPNFSWNLPNYINEVSYTFDQTITIGGSTTSFNGTVTQPLEQAPLLFTVMYEVDGTQTSASVEAGTLLAEPTAPTKEGYT
ncbi:Ig-like domain-containing protein, partial [Listeria monocytogenes]